jgi:PhoH-like ATPase
MKKYFVLDTNVLLHNPNSIFAFADNTVVIPIAVIEEIDHFKQDNTEAGRNARFIIRALDKLRRYGPLAEGVPLEETEGKLVVDFEAKLPKEYPLRGDSPDNRILGTAYKYTKNGVGMPVIFVSKDINARVKADALGIKAQDFEKEKVDIDTLYTGWREFDLPERDIDKVSKAKSYKLDLHIKPNEFVLLVGQDNPHKRLLMRSYGNNSIIEKLKFQKQSVMGISPRNIQQVMSFDLLLDDRVQLVALVGQAGTGKTLIALAAGLYKVTKQQSYESMLVTRPIMPLGKDIGYLPGSKEEKLESWMQPIFDNLSFVLQVSRSPGSKATKVDDLIDSNVISLEPLTYMRGRSIPNQFIILDEAQNLTPHEVKTVISRAGHGSKLVLTGDPYQIDNPYLDSASNGLSYVVERMKDQKLFGAVRLERSERSTLASLAAELL